MWTRGGSDANQLEEKRVAGDGRPVRLLVQLRPPLPQASTLWQFVEPGRLQYLNGWTAKGDVGRVAGHRGADTALWSTQKSGKGGSDVEPP